MNPKTPELLGRVLKLAEQVLDRPTGDPRRRDAVEKLFDEVHAMASGRASDSAGLVNHWTLLLMQMLRRAEAEGVSSNTDESVRALTIGSVLLGFVQRDAGAALQLKAGHVLPDHVNGARR